MGLDQLPVAFRHLRAPGVYQPFINYSIFHLPLLPSLIDGNKQASYQYQRAPPTKIRADFRPISITPVLTRIIEQTVVQQYLCPAPCHHPLAAIQKPIRHSNFPRLQSTLIEKLDWRIRPVNAFNWLFYFFSGHSLHNVPRSNVQLSMLNAITKIPP